MAKLCQKTEFPLKNNVFEMPLKNINEPTIMQAFLVAFHKAMGKHVRGMNYTSRGSETQLDFGGYAISVEVRILGPVNPGKGSA